MGTVLATLAGYDADAAITLWEKMQASTSSTVATFMSTHPSSTKRISELQKNNPQVKRDYGPAALFPSSAAATQATTTATPQTTTKKSTTSTTKKTTMTSKKSGTGYRIGQ